MPRWVHDWWRCPHCDLKTEGFDALLWHAELVGQPFWDALDRRRDELREQYKPRGWMPSWRHLLR